MLAGGSVKVMLDSVIDGRVGTVRDVISSLFLSLPFSFLLFALCFLLSLLFLFFSFRFRLFVLFMMLIPRLFSGLFRRL